MKQPSYKIVSLTEATNSIDKSRLLAVDLETLNSEGLYSSIQLVQFMQAGWEHVLLVEKPEVIELSVLLKQCHIIAHNSSYEVSTIQKQLGKEFGIPEYDWKPKDFEDTLLLSKLHFYQKEKHSLDACYTYALGFDPYKAAGVDKKVMQSADWSKLTNDKLLYATIDVFYLLDLYHTMSHWVDDQTYKLTKRATELAFSFQTNGLPINLDKLKEQRENNKRIIEAEALPVNPNSWQQVRPYIGEDESDGLALATFALEGNERAAKINKVRKLAKQNSFLDKFERLAIDNRIYGHFTFTTKSGRGNCKEQNLQQLPRTTKGLFEAGNGKVLVSSDFAQLELRYACAVSGEPLMAQMFKDEADLHTETANMMDVPRQQAKTCNFNLLYGGSAKMLRNIFIKDADMLLPIDEVQQLKRKWHNLWKVLTAWQDKVVTKYRQGKKLETLLGRPLYAKLYTDALNLPIQGASSDISKLAMHKMFKELENHKDLQKASKFVNFVHDSFMWECPEDPAIYEPLAQITANAMKEAWDDLVVFTEIPDLPMPVDVTVGKNWGDMEKGENIIYSLYRR